MKVLYILIKNTGLVPNTSGGGPSLGVSLSVEDRSDTWSVDAMASDSEADPVHRNDDILLIDEPERAQHASRWFLQLIFF